MTVMSSHMLQSLGEDHLDWIEHYMSSRRSGYHSLLRLLQHFAERHGFSRQRICRQKKSQEELEATRIAFGKQFHDKHPGIDMDVLYISDETGMYYDMCPNTIWAIRGGGSYKAWMNGIVWKYFLRDVLKAEIENPSVLLVDKFDSHVSEESENIVGEELGSELCALPPNSTSHCQPLDAFLMGPFKEHLRDLWVLTKSTATTTKEKSLVMINRAIKAWVMVMMMKCV
ncbi:hypothetical protein B5M09_013260 [Aphanomyces astaci]|uniref:DDE-1 domain-containing protein n=1 Tax=Aphanomyces astaci TaxID=112090 RepID=A0A3R7X8Q3_APHAT|nr:hypothetical protein B5M09_013260 [Aphanomyces astaci]